MPRKGYIISKGVGFDLNNNKISDDDLGNPYEDE